MNACDINIKSDRFQTLKHKSGVSDSVLATTVAETQNKYGRNPNLDEIPGANSEVYLRKNIKIDENNLAETEEILEYTNTTTPEEAMIKINNQMHQDLEVTISPVGSLSFVNIKRRPSAYDLKPKPFVEAQEDVSDSKNTMALRLMLDKFKEKYGIDIKYVDSNEIKDMNIPNAGIVNAFVYNGDIYVNTDVANVKTSLVHELMHIFLGAVRFTNPELYFSLVSSVEELDYYEEKSLDYPNRTRNDVNEEIFVSEFSKYITGIPSLFNNLDEKILNQIDYDVKRVLDSMLMGNYSVNSLKNPYMKSIVDLARLTESTVVNQTDNLAFIQYSSKIHRQVSNLKEQLFKEDKLVEDCV